MPVGNITRGTTNANRLRRVDRWLQTWPALKTTDNPLIVDLGYGASAATTVELAIRIRKTRPDARFIGLEIAPDRVELARTELQSWKQTGQVPPEIAKAVEFSLGGFEVPLPGSEKAVAIRAFNVLRQYDESEVGNAWDMMTSRLQDDGVLIDGTCDEIGRICSWIAVTKAGPQTLTIALKLDAVELPSIVAERLPKALIHHNVPGEPIHEFLSALDKQWLTHAGLAPFGPTQRWIATAQSLAEQGWLIRGNKSRWRLGELTIDYAAIAALPKK